MGRWTVIALGALAAMGLAVWLLLRGPEAPERASRGDTVERDRPGMVGSRQSAQGRRTEEPQPDGGRADKPERQERRTAKQRSTDYLIRRLHRSKSFRARAQAALLLSRRPRSRVVDPLIAALDDRHAAVRSAAATALGRVGGPKAREALEQRKRADSEQPVRQASESAAKRIDARRAPAIRPGGRYYVAIGGVSGSLPRALRAQVSRRLRRQVRGLGGVRMSPGNESSNAVQGLLREQGLHGFHLDVNVTEFEHRPGSGTRAALNIIVGSYPGRDMRAIVQGSAQIPGGATDAQGKLAVLEGAVKSAVRKLPQAFAAASR